MDAAQLTGTVKLARVRKRIPTIFKIFIFVVVLPMTVMSSFYFLNQNGFFDIDNIEIIISNSTDQPSFLKPVVAELDQSLEKWRGKSLWHLDLDEVRGQLSKQPWLKEIHLSRQWPSRLSIVLQVKEVRLLVVGKNGELTPIAEDAQVLPSVELRKSPDVIVAQNDVFLKREDLRQLALKAIDALPLEGSFSRRSISELRWKEKEGVTMVLSQSGLRVKLGNEKFAVKSYRVSQVLDYLKANDKTVEHLDADLSNKVVAHREFSRESGRETVHQ